MKNLLKFTTTEDYNKGNKPYINVSYVEQTDSIYYNDDSDEIEQEPFTIEILSLEEGYDGSAYLFTAPGNDGEDNNKWTKYWKYKLNDGPWTDFTNENSGMFYIDNISVNDKIQILGTSKRGIGFVCLCRSNQWGDWMSGINDGGASIKLSGNFMSTINGLDYTNNTSCNYPLTKLDAEITRNLYVDIEDLWLPKKGLANNQFQEFGQSLTNLEQNKIIKDFIVDYAPKECFLSFYAFNDKITGEVRIGAKHNEERAFADMFSVTNIECLKIMELDNDIPDYYNNGQPGYILTQCPYLTEIYNYTNHYVSINYDGCAQNGTYYYVDYGQDMSYDPSTNLPEGWTTVAIQPNTPNE